MAVVTKQQLEDAALDAQTLEDVANGAFDAPDVVPRLGGSIKTVAKAVQALGYKVPVAFATSLNVTEPTFTVEYLGEVYSAKPSSLPFVTTGSFVDSQWLLVPRNQLITEFETVAEMVASSSPRLGQLLQTQGYNSANDGGSALYRVVGAATGTPDGGSYIDLTTAGLQAELVNSGSVEARQFGIVGDGVADDTTQFQALIDFAQQIVVDCNVRITDEIAVPSTVRKITGSGKIICDVPADKSGLLVETTDLLIDIKEMVPPPQNGTTSLSNSAIEFHNASKCQVAGVHFQKRGTAQAEGGCVLMWGCSQMTVDRCTVDGNGVDYDNTVNNHLTVAQSFVSIWQSGNDITVSNCISKLNDGIIIQSDKAGLEFGDIENISVTNCICDGTAGHGFLVYTDSVGFPANYIRNVTFSNCQMVNGTGKLYNGTLVERIYGVGFYSQGAYNVIFNGCLVRNSLQNTSIAPTNPIPVAAFASTNGGLNITACMVEDCPSVPAVNINAQRDQSNIYDGRILIEGLQARNVHKATEDAAIRVTQADELAIISCTIDDYDGIGIWVDASGAADETESTDTVQIANCIIKNGDTSSAEAILVEEANSVSISNNTIETVDAIGIQVRNVGVHSVCANIITDWNRGGGSAEAIRTATGTPAETVTVGSVHDNNCILRSGTGRGMSLGLAAVCDGNSFFGVAETDKYVGAYGELRTSANSATPDVQGCRVLRSSSGSTTTITDFTGGTVGQRFTLIQESGGRTINHGTGIITKTGSSIVLTSPAAATFVYGEDGNYYET